MKTWDVKYTHEVSYRVAVTSDVFSPRNEALADAAGLRGDARRLVVVDANVQDLWGEQIRAYFSARGVAATVFRMQAGEDAKTSATALAVAAAADEVGIRRRDPIIAVGGGGRDRHRGSGGEPLPPRNPICPDSDHAGRDDRRCHRSEDRHQRG